MAALSNVAKTEAHPFGCLAGTVEDVADMPLRGLPNPFGIKSSFGRLPRLAI
jgi:hypothetical protein